MNSLRNRALPHEKPEEALQMSDRCDVDPSSPAAKRPTLHRHAPPPQSNVYVKI
jgi:hypothetical protein